MKKILLVFQSTNFAMQAESLLKKEGINVQLMPTPREITVSCGFSIKIAEEDIKNILEFIRNKVINVKAIYSISIEGNNRIIEEIGI